MAITVLMSDRWKSVGPVKQALRIARRRPSPPLAGESPSVSRLNGLLRARGEVYA
jgi:hypothetical protein